ncbi:MAG: hypothetical protein ACJA0H_001090 [Francisellaceae bacterium]|jgi:hypothetical protein
MRNSIVHNVDKLIAGIKLHQNVQIEWVIIFLLKNPRTDFDCPHFNKEFAGLFPDEDAIDILETLYRQGIANKHAMRQYYIDETSISIIDGRRRIIQFQKLESDTPIWDF